MLLVQDAVRIPPAPGPLPHGVLPGHYLGGTIPIILSNSNGMSVHILPTGATVQRLIVPDEHGLAEDVVLGFDDLGQYQVRIWHASLMVLALLHAQYNEMASKGLPSIWQRLLSSSTALSMVTTVVMTADE